MSTPKKTRTISDLDKTILAVKFLIEEVENLQNRVKRLEAHLDGVDPLPDISEFQGEIS